MRCYRCGKVVPVQRSVGRQETCPECGIYLHCCRNCRFFDEKAYHQCRESEAEWVRDKESANFCDYFQPGEGKRISDKSRAEEARRKLDQLFSGKKPEE